MARKAQKPTPKKPAKKAKKPSRDPVTIRVSKYDPTTGEVVGKVRRVPRVKAGPVHINVSNAGVDPAAVAEMFRKHAGTISGHLDSHRRRRRPVTIVEGGVGLDKLRNIDVTAGLDIRSTGRVPGPPAATPWFESSTLSIVLGTIMAVVALTLWLAWKHS